MPLRLRRDPWAVDYSTSLQIDDDENADLPYVDCSIEVPCADWQPIAPEPTPSPATVAFVDGVQRLEAHVTVEEGGETLFGALASIAVGAVRVDADGASIIQPIEVRRTLALGNTEQVFAVAGTTAAEPIEIDGGSQMLKFTPRSSDRTEPDSWRDAIDQLRRDLEQQFGQRLVDGSYSLVVMDGRLRLRPAPPGPVVGYTKTLHRQYLPADCPTCRATLPQLRARERSPLFLIEEKEALYSWYLRLNDPRPIDHSLAGIVRLEASASMTRDEAVELANQTALHLPDFASSAERDPRAPQNLLPIGGLETRLRHEMGDPTWVRRAIERYLYQQTAS
ncbi:MAG TPA: hypothetical protein VGK54_13670 [Chloroflexota bacterium]